MKAGVVVLAGGEASRLPGKLELDAGGVPLVARVVRGVAEGREVVVSCKGSFAPDVDALLDVSCVVDRWPRRGPLAGLVSAASRMRSRYIFAVAADGPFIDSPFLAALEAECRDGDEAVVPAHGDGSKKRLEPLAALYDRFALLREGFAVLRQGNGGVRDLLGRLNARIVEVPDDAVFANVNTAGDYARFRAGLERGAQGS